MALNKRRSLGSASSTPAPAKTSEAQAERGNGNSDFTAIQTALEAIVNSIAELAKKIESTRADQAKLAERLDAIEAAMEEDETDSDSDEETEEETDEDEGEDVTPDDIDFAKVSTILHDMGDDEQKEVLSAAMKKLGVKRLRLPDLRKNPEQLFAVAEVLNEDYEVDVDDMLK
jgi:chromosome segregation ATPase